MELPHLRLYLRRVMAAPKGLSLAEALRTARLRALLAVLGWVVATVTMQWLQLGALDQLIQTNNYNQWLQDAPGLFYVLATTLGVWGVLFVTADEMHSLAVQGRRGSPDWYSAPLESWRALLATLLAALCAGAPLLLGMALFVVLSSGWAEVNSLPLSPLQLPQLAQFALGLPAYCLASAVLALALRSARFGGFLPLLLAGAGTLFSLTQYELRANWQGSIFVVGGLADQGLALIEGSRLPEALLLFGTGCGILVALALLWIARQSQPPALAPLLLCLLLALPVLPLLRQMPLLAAQFGQGYYYFEGARDEYVLPDEGGLLLLRYTAGTLWPTSLAHPYRIDGSNSRISRGIPTSTGFRVKQLTAALPYARLLPPRLLSSLVATLAWWCIALAALQAVRHPRRPSALREAARHSARSFA